MAAMISAAEEDLVGDTGIGAQRERRASHARPGASSAASGLRVALRPRVLALLWGRYFAATRTRRKAGPKKSFVRLGVGIGRFHLVAGCHHGQPPDHPVHV